MALMNGVMSERMDVEPTDWFTPASNGERSTQAEQWQTECKAGLWQARKNFYTERVTKDGNDIPTVI